MTGSERAEVNRLLAQHGFAQLGDAGLLPQLALAIEDETTLKRVLNLTTPCERTQCYEALRPHLRFTPRPMDVLLSEIALDADIRQLPVMKEDGTLRAFGVAELAEVRKGLVQSVAADLLVAAAHQVAQEDNAMAEALAKHGYEYKPEEMQTDGTLRAFNVPEVQTEVSNEAAKAGVERGLSAGYTQGHGDGK